jgi:hypothetical protein
MKKILLSAVFVLSLPIFAFAQVASSTIVVPTNFTSEILAQASALFNSFEGYITLIIGVLLALVAIEFLINAFHK